MVRLVLGTRRFERPQFLTDCFEEPEAQFFYMYHHCQCTERKLAEIHGAFKSKQLSLVDGLQTISKFFQLLAKGQLESAKHLLTVGVASKSFIGSQTASLLFESELSIFNEEELRPEPSRILFCDIRTKFQSVGKLLLDKASEMLQEAQVGELHLVEKQIGELGSVFEDRFKELSGRVKEKVHDLHTREGVYRQTEDKLMAMIVEYRKIIESDAATRRPEVLEAAGAAGEPKSDPRIPYKRKNYSTLIQLESQCKISHYELNNLALELKDAYL